MDNLQTGLFSNPAPPEVKRLAAEAKPDLFAQPNAEAKELAEAFGRPVSVKPLKPEERVAIQGLEHDSRFFIKRMTRAPTEQDLSNHRYVPLKQGNETIYLNVKSLCKRLLLTQDQVQASDNLQGLIENRARQLNEAVAYYNKIFDNFKKFSPDTHLAPDELERMVIASHGLWLGNEVAEGFHPAANLLIKLKEKQVILIDLNDLDAIGLGSHAIVFKVHDVANDIFYAMKAGDQTVEAESANIEAANLVMQKAQPVPFMYVAVPLSAFNAYEKFVKGKVVHESSEESDKDEAEHKIASSKTSNEGTPKGSSEATTPQAVGSREETRL